MAERAVFVDFAEEFRKFGAAWPLVARDRYRLCLGHFRKGICDNGRTIRRNDIERRVLAGLTDKLVSPEAVAVAKLDHRHHEHQHDVTNIYRPAPGLQLIQNMLDTLEAALTCPPSERTQAKLLEKAVR